MKCLILAGGSGDRLWPLSRKNFPKQFMETIKGHSMFQEAILRNIPFCDEFLIITNKKYEKIVKGQMQNFQELKYTIFMEDAPLKTAPPVVTLALNLEEDEELLIATTDNIIEGEYNKCITQLKDTIKQDKIAVVVSSPKERPDGKHYFENSNGKIKYTSSWGKNCVVDCGIMGAKVSTLLKNVNGDFLEKCKNIQIVKNLFVEGSFDERVAIADIIKTDNFELVNGQLSCSRITDIMSYYNFVGKKSDKPINSIGYNCKDVNIINTANDRLVVANDLRNIFITNTKDAVFITKKDSKSGIKEIAKLYYPEKKQYFDDYPIYYQDWGVEETLNFNDDYKINKVILYPKCSFNDTVLKGRVVNYVVLDGEVETLKVKTNSLNKLSNNQSISFESRESYNVTNVGKRNVVMIKTENKKVMPANEVEKVDEGMFVKLKPALKDFIWGGRKIKEVLNKSTGKLDVVAESWELSAHPAGQSKIATGRYKGETFSDYIEEIGKENLGWKVQSYERFPMLIKFIDSRESLSVQVHPDDEYAFANEGDYGKNEMWYIMEAEKDASVYIGFNKDITKEEIQQRIKNNTLIQVMNKVPVKAGEAYFITAGTVHAIGGGCLICEVQQSSNVTYRLYDYGREGYKGKKRALHIDKALEIADLNKKKLDNKSRFSALEFPGYTKQLLGQCKYFVVTKYKIKDELMLSPTGSSFRAVIVIDGDGKIGNDNIMQTTEKGDTWFFGSKEVLSIKGNLTVIVAGI